MLSQLIFHQIILVNWKLCLPLYLYILFSNKYTNLYLLIGSYIYKKKHLTCLRSIDSSTISQKKLLHVFYQVHFVFKRTFKGSFNSLKVFNMHIWSLNVLESYKAKGFLHFVQKKCNTTILVRYIKGCLSMTYIFL